MGRTRGIMFTMTTYGTWLRGDKRKWVDDGIIMPPDPVLEACDRERMKHEQYFFAEDQLLEIGAMMGKSLRERFDLHILALTIQRWHVHLVTAATSTPVADVVKCAKEAVRYGLRPGRPIWTDGYDKRFCFDDRILLARIRYAERHIEERGWPARPWDFIEEYPLAVTTPSPPPLAGG
jgi:hypothetical protein